MHLEKMIPPRTCPQILDMEKCEVRHLSLQPSLKHNNRNIKREGRQKKMPQSINQNGDTEDNILLMAAAVEDRNMMLRVIPLFDTNLAAFIKKKKLNQDMFSQTDRREKRVIWGVLWQMREMKLSVKFCFKCRC